MTTEEYLESKGVTPRIETIAAFDEMQDERLLTARQQFAAAAMNGMLSAGDADSVDNFADAAYLMADAMIAAGEECNE